MVSGFAPGGPMILSPRPPRAFPCPLSGEQKPEAGCGKVRGQPLVSDISHVRYIFLKKGRALFQASFAPQAWKPGGSRAKARGAVTHLSWHQQLLVGRLIINMYWLATETLEMRLVVCTPPPPSLLFQSMILQCISKENVGILPGNQYSEGNPFSFLSVRQPDSLGRAARHYPFIFIYLFI